MAENAPTESTLSARLDRLERKIDALTEGLAAVAALSSKADLIGEALGDSAAFAWNEAEQRGIDPIERGTQGLELAIQLSEPANMELVGKLLERTDALEAAVGALDGVDGDDLARALKQTTALLGNPQFQALLAAAPEALEVAGPATTALTETRGGGWQPKGPFGALMAITDPDVQKAVGFTLAIAKKFGSKL